MTEKEAYKILGLPPGTEMEETKKRYRQLIVQVHPDIHTSAGENYAYSAQEINLAFSFLKKRTFAGNKTYSHNRQKGFQAEVKHTVQAWDAPVNENAYTEREILHYAEDCNGTALGNFCIAKGKYLWKTEEDFPLFLLSIYQCSKHLLDEADSCLPAKRPSIIRRQIQAELTYLLAQQFIDATSLLKELAKEEAADKDGNRTFYISAMLEPSPSLPASAAALEPGELLCPSGIRNHKLYLKNLAGKELGYLSFLDDRLYYIAVPLFEQKKVRVRIQAAGRPTGKKRKQTMHYQKLQLWIKLLAATGNALPENLNLQIKQLLEQYRRLP